MADQQVEVFDPSKLMDGVRDRIKATFVSLIPEAAWDQMVQAEIDRFTTTTKIHNQYGADTIKQAGFVTVAQEVITASARERLLDILSKPEEQMKYFNGKTFELYIRSYVEKHAQDIFTSFVMKMMESVMQGWGANLKYEIERSISEAGRR